MAPAPDISAAGARANGAAPHHRQAAAIASRPTVEMGTVNSECAMSPGIVGRNYVTFMTSAPEQPESCDYNNDYNKK